MICFFFYDKRVEIILKSSDFKNQNLILNCRFAWPLINSALICNKIQNKMRKVHKNTHECTSCTMHEHHGEQKTKYFSISWSINGYNLINVINRGVQSTQSN